MTQSTVSDRLTQVPSSPMRKLAPFAMAAKKQGVHVYYLNIGDPDIKTPQVMMDVLTHWQDNPIRYGQSQGEVPFLEALRDYYRKLGFPFIDVPHIQATSGGSEAIFMAMYAICDPGDEIIVFEPFYANYNGYAATSHTKLVPIATSIDDGFHLPKRDVIERAITAKTKGILICNPSNPTGTVYTKAEMDMLADIVKTHGLFFLSDEVYREYVYDGRKQTSILSYMEQMPEQCILLDSMSKRYSLCGARVGALVSLNADIMAGALRIAQSRLASGTIDQAIAAKLSDVPDTYIQDVQKEYDARRNALYTGLKNVPGVIIPKPEGAFYSIVGLPVDDAEAFCKWLLTDFRDNNETVMLAPAAGFYATPGKGKNEVRIAYILNVESIKRCVELLKLALIQYAK